MMNTKNDKRNSVNGAESMNRGGLALGRTGSEASQVVTKRNPHEEFLTIASWNVGSMTGKYGEVVDVLHRRKVGVCGVQEVRWKGSGTRIFGDYKFFWSGGKSANAGVGILIRNEWIDKVVSATRVNERIIGLKLVIGKDLVNIFSVYVPQVGRTEEEKDQFWIDLFDTVSCIPDSEKVIVAGDLNGHIGQERLGYEAVHGGYSFGLRNTEGERILEFAVATSMVICNSTFKKRENQLITYESGGVASTVDYILTRVSDRKSVQNTKTIPGEECVRQHRLLVAVFKFARVADKRKKKYVPKLKVWKLKDDHYKRLFAEKVNLKNTNECHDGGVNDKWQKIRNILVSTAEEVCGTRRNPPRHKETWWWNDEVAKAVTNKRLLFKTWQKSKTNQDRSKYCQTKQACKKAIANAKRIKSQKLAEEVNSDEGRRNVFRIAKQMAKTGQDVTNVNCLRSGNGKVIVNGEDVKTIWKDYMEKLLNEENIWDQDVTCEVKEGPECIVTREEVVSALRKMRNGKAAGQSGVVNEMLRAAGDIGVDWLTDLCNSIISERKIPEDWRRSIIVPVYKGKGDPLDCGSYRAIKLLEHGMKVIEQVLAKRIREQVKIDDMQFGFTQGKSTTDAIFIVRQLQEKFRAKDRTLFYAFVDLEKAFDRVPREVVRWALRKAGVEEWLVETTMAMYEGAETAVRTEHGLTDWFKVLVGLHQGSVLSPLLFIIVMDVLSREIRGGLPWELLYADDLVLMAESEAELKQKLLTWKSALEAKGLKVNVNKTKVMFGGKWRKDAAGHVKHPCGVCGKGVGSNSVLCLTCDKWIHKRCSGVRGSLTKVQNFECRVCKTGVTKQDDVDMQIGNDIVFKKVHTFCYLGDMLSSDGGCDHAVSARINKAWNKFRELKPILCAKSIGLNVKGKVYEACVRSCMVYGGETWAVSVENTRRLERTEMRMLRMMCGITLRDRFSNADVRNRFGIECVGDVIRRSRLRWFGHVERKQENDWAKTMLTFEVAGKRIRGRPRKTWMEVVKNDLRSLGLNREDAQNRDLWRSVIHGRQANLGDL